MLRHVTAGGPTWEAVVDRLGGGLCSLRRDGFPLVEERAAGEPAARCAGSVLFPWPNRVRDARWTHHGVAQQLPITDPELGHANHGLVLDTWFTVLDRAPYSVSLQAQVPPQPGYPFEVALQLHYCLDADGLTVRSTVQTGPAAAPVALGFHPYLRLGDMPTEDLAVTVNATTVLETDDRLIPVGSRPVVGSATDLRRGVQLGDRALNHCYHGLTATDGRRQVDVVGPGPQILRVWFDECFDYVQVYVCPDFPRGSGGSARALAVEPMTAAPDALNSGAGLRWLDPHAAWACSWGITVLS